MELSDLFGDFFTHEAGQRRRAWLEEKERDAAESLRYALGPDLYPRVNALAQLAALFSPGQDVMDARHASADLMDWEGPLDTAGDAATLAAALGSMMLPGGVSSYRQGFDDLVEEGMRLHQSGRVNMFAGPSAKNADMAALETAAELEAKGIGRDDIWRETGWFRGVDGKWRFEIDDSQASVSLPRASVPGSIPEMKIFRRAVNHDELHKAYPELGSTGVFVSNIPGARGQWSGNVTDRPNTAMLTVSPHAAGDPSVFLHETQHGIQDIEGFARGGTVSLPRPGTPEWDVFEEMRNADVEPSIDFQTFFRHNTSTFANEGEAQRFYNKFLAKPSARPDSEIRRDAAREAYRRLAGEVEARNVQERRTMNAAQRRETPPWRTQDRPDAQQIIKFHLSGGDEIGDYLADVLR